MSSFVRRCFSDLAFAEASVCRASFENSLFLLVLKSCSIHKRMIFKLCFEDPKCSVWLPNCASTSRKYVVTTKNWRELDASKITRETVTKHIRVLERAHKRRVLDCFHAGSVRRLPDDFKILLSQVLATTASFMSTAVSEQWRQHPDQT